jgi:hypothetical protein
LSVSFCFGEWKPNSEARGGKKERQGQRIEKGNERKKKEEGSEAKKQATTIYKKEENFKMILLVLLLARIDSSLLSVFFFSSSPPCVSSLRHRCPRPASEVEMARWRVEQTMGKRIRRRRGRSECKG